MFLWVWTILLKFSLLHLCIGFNEVGTGPCELAWVTSKIPNDSGITLNSLKLEMLVVVGGQNTTDCYSSCVAVLTKCCKFVSVLMQFYVGKLVPWPHCVVSGFSSMGNCRQMSIAILLNAQRPDFNVIIYFLSVFGFFSCALMSKMKHNQIWLIGWVFHTSEYKHASVGITFLKSNNIKMMLFHLLQFTLYLCLTGYSLLRSVSLVNRLHATWGVNTW